MERDKMEGEEMKIVHADNFYGTSDVERDEMVVWKRFGKKWLFKNGKIIIA